MADRHRKTAEVQQFTLDQLKTQRSRVVSAAKQSGGAIVVDEEGNRRFSIWIPQQPLETD